MLYLCSTILINQKMETYNFKIGDKVKVIGAYCLTNGLIGEIRNIEKDGRIFIDFPNVQSYSNVHHVADWLELIQEPVLPEIDRLKMANELLNSVNIELHGRIDKVIELIYKENTVFFEMNELDQEILIILSPEKYE